MNIIGTVKNSVKYALMDHKWQEKKNQLGKNKMKELLPADRQLMHFQEQADAIRESQKPAGIDAKLASGAQLTPEEIEYLRRTNPQALKEYEKMQQERENYERVLRNCKSKEEAERLKMNKMGEYLSSVKKISTNPNIPKSAKLALLQKIMQQAAGINKEHLEFTRSPKYKNLPETDEEAREDKKTESKEVVKEDATHKNHETEPELSDVLENLAEPASDADLFSYIQTELASLSDTDAGEGEGNYVDVSL